MGRSVHMSELDALMKAFGESGGDSSILANKEVAHFVVSGHSILSMQSVEGLEVKAKETLTGISASIRVREGIKIQNPVHLCFGILHKKGNQKIKMDVQVGKECLCTFYCSLHFPES